MITGPWDHLQGSSGEDVGQAGYGSLQELWLRWFDRYVKGKKDPKLLRDVKPFTYFEQGTGKWVTTKKYVDRDLHAASFRLSGSAAVGGSNGGLVREDAVHRSRSQEPRRCRRSRSRGCAPAPPTSGPPASSTSRSPTVRA